MPSTPAETREAATRIIERPIPFGAVELERDAGIVARALLSLSERGESGTASLRSGELIDKPSDV